MIKKDFSIKKICNIYIISLIPLIIFGFYKNGIKLYNMGYVNIFGMLKPLLIVLIGYIIGMLVNLIYGKLHNIKGNILDICYSSFHPLYGVLIGSISSINMNLLLYIVVTSILLFLSKYINNIKINIVSLCSLVIFFIMNIFSKFSFLNKYEVSNKFNMNAIDYLFGKGSGGILTTCIILIIICFIYLYNNKWYKKSVSLYSIISFSIIVIIYCFINNSVNDITSILFSNGILFSFVYIASEPISSSYTKVGSIIYGVVVGILTFCFYLINPMLSSLGGILIASIFNSLIDLKFE